MFRKILVALDQSPRNEGVFATGIQLARLSGATLLLAHVLTGEEDVSPGRVAPPTLDYFPLDASPQTLEFYQKQWQSYEQEGLEMLRQRATQARSAGVTAAVHQAAGNAGPRLCEMATETGADLILIGRRGRRGLSEMFLGSVSNYVVHHAPCAVLVIEPAVAAGGPETAQAKHSQPAH